MYKSFLILFSSSSSYASQKTPYTLSNILDFAWVSSIYFLFTLLSWIQGRRWINSIYLLLMHRWYLFINIFFKFFLSIPLFQFVHKVVKDSFTEAQNSTCALICVVTKDSKQVRKVISVQVVFQLRVRLDDLVVVVSWTLRAKLLFIWDEIWRNTIVNLLKYRVSELCHLYDMFDILTVFGFWHLYYFCAQFLKVLNIFDICVF